MFTTQNIMTESWQDGWEDWEDWEDVCHSLQHHYQSGFRLALRFKLKMSM